jgi:RNA polymerase sigma-70 factor (ECF subfamily)
MDEQCAIACLKRGDLSGLEWLVQHYQVRAIHAAYLVVGDVSLAEDVTQSAFLQAAERIEQFDETRPFGPWFLRSVVNAARKAARRQNRQVSLDVRNEQQALALLDSLHDGKPGPEIQFISEEIRQAVWAALYQLKPEHRAAIILKYFLDLSDIESAQLLDRPLTTIKWWIYTARMRLRNLLHL